MKNARWRGAAVLLALLGLFTSPARAVMIQFDPLHSDVGLGDRFGIDVIVSGLHGASGPQIVSAFDLDVLYDASVLSAAAVEFGSGLGLPDIDALTSIWLTPGRIDFASVSFLQASDLFALQDDHVVLARLFFDAVGVGTSALLFDSLSPPGVLLVGDDPYSSLPLTHVGQGAVTVTAHTSVPEPGTFALGLTGLLLAGVLRRRGAVARSAR